MSSLKEDITTLFDSEVVDKQHKNNNGTPYNYGVMYAVTNEWSIRNTNFKEIVAKHNLGYKFVEETEHDNGSETVIKFFRLDDDSVVQFVKISFNSYEADRWDFVTPKEVTKIVYE